MSSTQHTDWSGKWFEIARERGDNHMVTLGRGIPDLQNEGIVTKSEFFNFSHTEMDGIAAINVQWAKLGQKKLHFPLLKNIRPPTGLKKITALQKAISHQKGNQVQWLYAKKTSPGMTSPPLVMGFTPSETFHILQQAQKQNLSLDGWLIYLLDQMIRPWIHQGDTVLAKWLFPINMRGAQEDPQQLCNQVSYITLISDPQWTPHQIQDQIRKSLKQNEHWGNWFLSSIGQYIGYKSMKYLSQKSAQKNFWLGTVSNLGNWISDSHYQPLDQKEVWFASPPGSINYPIGFIHCLFDHKLSISLRIHPSTGIPTNENKNILRQLRSALLSLKEKKRTWSAACLLIGIIFFSLRDFSVSAQSLNPQLTSRWFSAFTLSDLNLKGPFAQNPSEQPKQIFDSQLREDFRVEKKPFSLILRPRLMFTNKVIPQGVDHHNENQGSTQVQWIEAFTQWNLSESTFIVYGLQNFQWGPAESFSPSNGIFMETVQQRTLTYQTKGKHLLRLNHSWTERFNTILMYELSDYSGDEEFLEGADFRHKILQKSEWNWNSGAEYFGFVVGGEEGLNPYLGEYINLNPYENLSIYFDLKQQFGTQAWYPVRKSDNGLIAMEQYRSKDNHLLSSLVGGLRLSSINGNDYRYEYIYFEPGLKKSEQQLIHEGLTSSQLSQQLTTLSWMNHLKGMGLQFPGQQFSYISFRLPDLRHINNWNLTGRMLLSHTDESSQYYLSTDWAMGNSGTWTVAGLIGPENAQDELGSPVHSSFFVGYEHVW